jgi:peptidoglycan/xylan/chitin deacetylase (PgdA/CDA1 family)
VPVARASFYIASASTLVLGVVAIVRGSVPPLIGALVLGLYLAQLGVGIACLRLQVFVDVVWRGPRGASGVALTFDDGPSPEHTPRVLDLLEKAGVKATFFVIGAKAEKWPNLIRTIVARGHAVGIHSYAHDRLLALRAPAMVAADLTRAVNVLHDLVGTRPTLFRPPVGISSPRIARALARLDLTVIGWSARGLDGRKEASPSKVAARVVRHLRDGAIVLLHDSAEHDDFCPASLEALPLILDAMRRRSLRGVRLDAWSAGAAKRAPVIRSC